MVYNVQCTLYTVTMSDPKINPNPFNNLCCINFASTFVALCLDTDYHQLNGTMNKP